MRQPEFARAQAPDGVRRNGGTAGHVLSGMRTRVDSQLEPIYEVNGAMRGVVVPAGRHAITLRYCPLSVIAGGGATLLGVVVSLLLFGIGRRRRPQDSLGSPTGPLGGPDGVEESATPPASSMSSSADEAR
jgi:hypothetical protein